MIECQQDNLVTVTASKLKQGGAELTHNSLVVNDNPAVVSDGLDEARVSKFSGSSTQWHTKGRRY